MNHFEPVTLNQKDVLELQKSFEKYFWIQPPETETKKTRILFCFNCGEQGHEGKVCLKPKYEEMMQSPSTQYL